MLWAQAEMWTTLTQLALQGGALALLFVVVIWLYPREAKAAREERATRDARFEQLVALMQNKFDERNSRVVQAIQEQTATLNRSMGESSSRIEVAVAKACRQAHA